MGNKPVTEETAVVPEEQAAEVTATTDVAEWLANQPPQTIILVVYVRDGMVVPYGEMKDFPPEDIEKAQAMIDVTITDLFSTATPPATADA